MNTLAIILKQIGSSSELNVTPYLADDNNIALREQIEQLAFERKHGDVHIKLSNRAGFFSALFLETIGSTRWEVGIMIDGTVRWRGEIFNKSIIFSLDTRWVDFDAFAKTKVFWERMKTKKVMSAIATGLDTGYMTLQIFFDLTEVYLGFTNSTLSDGGTIFSGFDLSEYSGRLLRDGTNRGVPIGNEGKMNDLAPSTTYANLFEAFQIYYNAEFYIDHATRNLTMWRRNRPKVETPKNIDALLCDDKEPQIKWIAEGKVDYIYTLAFVSKAAPTLVSTQAVYIEPALRGLNQITAGEHSWCVLGVAGTSAQPIIITQVLTLTLPPPPEGFSGWWVTLAMGEITGLGVTDRRLYRRLGLTGQYYRVKINLGNSGPVVYTDASGDLLIGNAPTLPSVRGVSYVWRRYNELTATWDEDIIDNGSNTPQGVIFDLRPVLHFMELGSTYQQKPDDPYDVFSFFGRETTRETFTNQWIDWFRTKRRGMCKVRDMDYSMHQPIICGRFPNDLTPGTNYSVKQFTSQLNKGETELELLSV